MKKILIILLFLNVCLRSQNLVPNWSFETYTACPGGGGEISKAVPWIGQTASGTTDYYNSCAIGNLNVPYSSSGFQYAKDGVGRVGFWLYGSPLAPNLREYAQVMLIDTLVNGNCYYIEFYANLANQSRWANNNLAANLSKTQYSTTGTGAVLNLPQHITNNLNPIVKDTLNWTKVSGIYVASGGEKYLTIGNFKDDLNTDTIKVFPTGGAYGSYYYLDAVSGYSINPTGILPWTYNNTSVAIGDSVYIGNTMGGTFASNWYTLPGVFIKSGSGIYVKPTINTDYVVQFTVCGVPRSDTLTVTVTGVGINELSNKPSLKLSPNPTTELLNIEIINKGFNIQNSEIEILNTLGQLVLKLPFMNEIDVSQLSSGCYLLKITTAEKHQFHSKFIKE